MDPGLEPLYAAATRPFARAGVYSWQFTLWKLRFDPVFFALLRRALFPDRGRLLDVGCGQGILLALLAAARDEFRQGRWPPGWPAPPVNLELRGVEARGDRVAAARRALGGRGRVDLHDIRDIDFPPSSAVVMLDVLHYLDAGGQQRVLAQAAHALGRGGLLLVREADAGAGRAFQLTRWSERLLEIGRGRLRNGLHFRSATHWTSALKALGFSVSAEPMSGGTPFANVLFVARKPPTPS